MTNTLQARGTIQVSGFILIGRDPGHRCRINQRSPPHTLPDTRPHIDMRKPFRTSGENRSMETQMYSATY